MWERLTKIVDGGAVETRYKNILRQHKCNNYDTQQPILHNRKVGREKMKDTILKKTLCNELIRGGVCKTLRHNKT